MVFWRKKEHPSFYLIWLITGIVFLLKTGFILGTTIRGLASTTWIIDDSIIEMAVARNVAHGLGFTLDGVHTTTGAPFLWIYTTSINHMIFGLDAAIRATLIESTLLGALCTVVVFFLALKLTQDKRIAWTAFLLSTFTSTAFFNAMNGMDTAMFTLFSLLAIATFFGVGRPQRWSSFVWGCVVGLFAGLACMTRGDGIFVLGSIGLVQLFTIWKYRDERAANWKMLWGIVLVWAVLFAIFMGWEFVQAGSPLPGNQVGRRAMSLSLHNFSFQHFSLPQYLKIVGWNVFQLEDLLRIGLGSFLLALVALLSGLLQPRLQRFASLVAIYIVVFFGLLVAYQWYFPDFHGLRYINPAIHLLFIFVAVLLWQLPEHKLKAAVVTFLSLCIIAVADYRHYDLAVHMPWAKNLSYVGRPSAAAIKAQWSLIDWMKTNLPKGTVVGVRDYGRVTLFDTNLIIEDISGNIYPEAVVAMDNGTLPQYLKSRNITYLMIPSLEDRQDQLYVALHSQLHLQEVPGAPTGPGEHLYKILP